jgi:hypothetical protein
MNVLLARGVDEKLALEALQIAISGGPENIDIIKDLIAANIKLLSPAFEYTIAIEDPVRKAPILDVLLKMGVGQETLDMALAAETRNAVTNKDTTSAQMLVETGASVSHNDGEALSVAVAARSTMLTELLLSGKHQPSRSNATKAFRALFTEEHSGRESHEESVFNIARILLPLGVEQPAIDSALRVALSRAEDSRYIDAQIDVLLLQHKSGITRCSKSSCSIDRTLASLFQR